MEFPRVLRPNEFRLVDLQLLLFNVPCHSVDPIAGGGGGGGGGGTKPIGWNIYDPR